MAYNDFSTESPENYEQKCLCVLLLDVSGSMQGDPIDQLNIGLQEFQQEIKNDPTTSNRLEIAIVTFGSNIDVVQDPSLINNFTMPTLAVHGSTKMVDGIKQALELVDSRKKWYRDSGQPYYRPWVILITDGVPDGDQDVAGISVEIEQGVQNKTFIFYAVGVEGYDKNILTQISSPSMPPSPLKGLKFGQFFKWLSASMSTVASSTDGATVDLPDPDWMKGFTI